MFAALSPEQETVFLNVIFLCNNDAAS